MLSTNLHADRPDRGCVHSLWNDSISLRAHDYVFAVHLSASAHDADRVMFWLPTVTTVGENRAKIAATAAGSNKKHKQKHLIQTESDLDFDGAYSNNSNNKSAKPMATTAIGGRRPRNHFIHIHGDLANVLYCMRINNNEQTGRKKIITTKT